MERRNFLKNTGAVIAGGSLIQCINPSNTLSKSANAPKPKYKVVYNQDCTHFFYRAVSSGKTVEPESVDKMVDEVALSGADLMLICPNGVIGRANYPSRIWQTMWDKPNKGLYVGWEQMKHLSDLGCNCLSRALDRCRHNNIGAGISIRMNDTHDTPWPDSPRHSDFYRQHPEWRLKAPYRIDGDYTFVYAMDYRQKEVRDYYLAFIREVLTDYKPDVLELDFMRFPLYFQPGEAYKYSSVMTEFVREIRQLCGTKVFLMARLPVTPASAYEYGFDVEALTHKGMIQAITPTAHFVTAWDTDLSSWREAVGDDVVLYAGTESCAYSPDGTRRNVMGLDESLLRGFAAGNYAKGADGIYLFNFFCSWEWEKQDPLYPAIKQLGDPAGLKGKAKTYCISAAWGNWHLGESDGPIQVPRIADTRISQCFNIAIGEEPSEVPVEVKFIIKGENLVETNLLCLHVNEDFVGRCTEIREEPGVKNKELTKAAIFKIKSDSLITGINNLVFRNDGAPVTVLAITVSVDGKTGSYS